MYIHAAQLLWLHVRSATLPFAEEHENSLKTLLVLFTTECFMFHRVAPHPMPMLMSAVLLPSNLWLRLMEIDIYTMSCKKGYDNVIELDWNISSTRSQLHPVDSKFQDGPRALIRLSKNWLLIMQKKGQHARFQGIWQGPITGIGFLSLGDTGSNNRVSMGFFCLFR